MRFVACLIAGAMLCMGALSASAAESAKCEVKGSFEGTNLPGAVASGEVKAGSQLALDLFGSVPSHRLLITITPAAAGARLTVAMSDVKAESDMFLETTLGATVLGLTVTGTFNGHRLDDISLLCLAAQ